MSEKIKKYLDEINFPSDLRKLPISALPQVSDEVREFVIDTITKTGGHFGAGLGVVELTTALHYVFNTPKDKIVFDTGHQGYPHKVLTGRKDKLHTIRQYGGLSGFLKRSESEYDIFGAGHASTSISAALGLATARDIKHEKFKVVSVIGDGAMTGGLAFEALNNCGVQQRDILVIMNDNNFSISPNVSAISNYFNKIYTSNTVQRLKSSIWDITGKFDDIGDRLRTLASKLEDGVKAIVTPGVLFEAFGFNYIGPINGHNTVKLVNILQAIKELKGPIFLHVVTQKGHGFKHATKETKYLHAIGKIDKVTGESLDKSTKPKPKNYQDVFGETTVELCEQNSKIVTITAAMPGGTGLNILQEKYPEKVIDVGIAEGHGVTLSAGMACEGIIPIVAIYSTFLQRAYDHIIHDIAIQKLHVVFCLDRAGVVGADGATHHGVMDLVYLRSIPNLTLMVPSNEQELKDMMFTSVNQNFNGPVAIRYPRGTGLGMELKPMKQIEIGKGLIEVSGTDIAILAIGNMVNHAVEAAEILSKEGISAEVINARFVKPLDTDLIDDLCDRFDKIITVEDGQKMGGFGAAVVEYITDKNYKVQIVRHGIADKFVGHGTQSELYRDLNLDAQGIAQQTKKLFIDEYISFT